MYLFTRANVREPEPSLAEVRLSMMEKEIEAGARTSSGSMRWGSTQWLADGISLEEAQ